MSGSGRTNRNLLPKCRRAADTGGAYTVENETHPLQMRCDRDGVLWLSGEFDMAEMERFLRTATAQVDGRRQVLDLSGLTFLDSSSIGAIVRFANFVCAKGLFLRNPSERAGAVLPVASIDGLAVAHQHPLSA
jgi:anti-anti-sigma factor